MAQQNQPSLEEAQAQLRYLQELYSQQYQLLENEIASFSMAIGTLNRNIELLENKDRLANSAILINAEGGAYIEASIKSMDRVMVYIGAGYLVEKGIEDAKLYLKGNSKKQEETFKKLAADKQKIEKELVDISYKLSTLGAPASPR